MTNYTSPDRQAPLFTIVVPLYNKEGHIAETLATVVAQTCSDWEIVVVDDGSKDASVARVQALGIDRLKLVEQANAGPGVARNRGIAEAAGTWVAFLDADDLWLPDHLAVLSEIIAAFPAAEVVGSGYVRGRRGSLSSVLAARRPGSPPRIVDYFLEDAGIWTSSVAVRTSVLRSSGGFGVAWPGEDLELWTRLALDHIVAVRDYVSAIYVQETGGAMDSGAGSSQSGDVVQDPVLARVERAIGDPRYAARHEALLRYRNRLIISYLRPTLYKGRTRLARAYLAMLLTSGGRAPAMYSVLSRLPPSFVRTLLRNLGRIRRWVGGKPRP